MIRNLKTMGIALAAVFALSAVVASAASAQNGLLTSTGPVTGVGTEIGAETNNFEAFGTVFTCKGAIYTIHKYKETPHKFVPSGSSTFTVTPHYEPQTKTEKNCIGTGGFFITVTMNGCDFVFHTGLTSGVGKTYKVTADIVCPAGKVIEVHAYSSTSEAIPVCTYTIGPQNGLSGPHLTDDGTGHIRLNGTFGGIHATRHAGLCGGEQTTNGGTVPFAKYTANVTITGKNEAGADTAISLSHL